MKMFLYKLTCLYRIDHNPRIMFNSLAGVLGKPSLEQVEADLRERLHRWQMSTRDPWLCSPDAVLERGGADSDSVCRSLDNGLLHYYTR